MAVILLLIVVAAGLYIAVRSYLHSESFRTFLAAKVGKAAKVDGEFSPFHWDGLAVRSKDYEATGEHLIRSLRIDDLETEVGLGGLQRGVWEIRNSSARRVEIGIDGRSGEGDEEPRIEKKQAEKARGSVPDWLPTQVEVTGLQVDEVAVQAMLDGGPVSASGIRLGCNPVQGADAYDVKLTGGRLELPYPMLPALRLESVRLRYQDGRVFLNHASAGAWSDAHLELAGEADRETRRYSLEGGISGVKCEEAFDETWSRRVSGTLESSLRLANGSGEPVAGGHAVLHHGVLTALPVLDSLAAYSDTRRFRTLTLDEASTDWQWQRGHLRFTRIRLGSEALIQIEGSLDIRGRNLDGRFRLGLAPGVLATLPGAETDVFLPGERGLLWAPLHVTGTLDDPEEDLTDRLIAAAGLRMYEILPQTGEKVLRYSRNVLGETVPDEIDKALEKGEDVIRDGTKIIREAGDVLDGILGVPLPR